MPSLDAPSAADLQKQWEAKLAAEKNVLKIQSTPPLVTLPREDRIRILLRQRFALVKPLIDSMFSHEALCKKCGWHSMQHSLSAADQMVTQHIMSHWRDVTAALCVLLALALAAFAVKPASAQGPAYPYTVTNTWTLSTTSPSLVAGQNVYYTTWTNPNCGTTWTKLTTTSLGNNVSTFTDATVSPTRDGGSFCYGVTALGTNGAESSKDSVSPVLIPPAPPTTFTGTVAINKTQDNVTWAWTQSHTKGIKYNELFCAQKVGGPLSQRWRSTEPETQAVLTMVPGQHQCGTTAVNANGISGASKLVTVTVAAK